jgi:uncharacterized protein YjbI with pentapeptide repeats
MLTCRLERSNLTKATFRKVWLEKSEFSNVDFQQADLSGLADHANNYKDCRFVATRFDHANLGYEGSRYEQCLFERASFRKSAFARTQFDGCTFAHCALVNIDFEASSFSRCKFVGPLRDVWFRNGYSHTALADEFGPAPPNRMQRVDFSEASFWGVTFGGGVDLSTVIPPQDGRHHLYDRWPERFRQVDGGLATAPTGTRQGIDLFLKAFEASSSRQDHYIVNEADMNEIFGESATKQILTLLGAPLR